MNNIKTYIGQKGQIVSHVQECLEGDELQLQGIDQEYKPNEPTSIPWAIRLSTDAIFDSIIHFGSKEGWLQEAKENKIATQTNDSWPPNLWRLMAKNKNKVEWGIEEVTNNTTNEMFEVVDNAIVCPMNSDIEDRKYKILNSGLLDDTQFCPNIMTRWRPQRPTTFKFKNDCKQICVTFMPNGPQGNKHKYYAEQGWSEGAHFTWADDGVHTIHKKGTVDYLIPVHEATVLDSTLGARIPSGSPIELTSDSINLSAQTNIILHIYR